MTALAVEVAAGRTSSTWRWACTDCRQASLSTFPDGPTAARHGQAHADDVCGLTPAEQMARRRNTHPVLTIAGVVPPTPTSPSAPAPPPRCAVEPVGIFSPRKRSHGRGPARPGR